jgi:hypothetical protein
VLKTAYTRGAREAFAKFADQPAPSKKVFKTTNTDTGLPKMPPPEDHKNLAERNSMGETKPHDSLGVDAAKFAFNVGMAMSTARHEGPGAIRGEPSDNDERRRENTIERAFQTNDAIGETSSMPRPAGGVYP